jgi:hypothetical protein
MSSTRPRRTSRKSAKHTPTRPKRARSRARGAIRPPESWITDPQALLVAMADGERAQHEAAEPFGVTGETRHTAAPCPAVQAQPEAPVQPVPALREDERLARQFESGVVVIVRRRRAA